MSFDDLIPAAARAELDARPDAPPGDTIGAVIERLARERDTFTADDVWAELGPGVRPDDYRFLSAPIKAAVTAGTIEKADDRTVPSRFCRHRIAVWQQAGSHGTVNMRVLPPLGYSGFVCCHCRRPVTIGLVGAHPDGCPNAWANVGCDPADVAWSQAVHDRFHVKRQVPA